MENNQAMNELRQDAVTGNWVIINPQSDTPSVASPCPYCPGNEGLTSPEIMAVRQWGTAPNTPGWNMRLFLSRYPDLNPGGTPNRRAEGMYNKMDGIGVQEILVETPDHQLRFAQFPPEYIEQILRIYQQRIQWLKKDVRFRYILVYKNHGPIAGAPYDHSHSVIMASPITPRRIKEEFRGAKEYYNFKERCVYCDIVRQEQAADKRVVDENRYFIAIVPFALRYPYEVWILPKEHETFYEDSRQDFAALAQMLKQTLSRLDKLLGNPSFNFAVHGGPNLASSRLGTYWSTVNSDYHWHIEISPKLIHPSGTERNAVFSVVHLCPEEAARQLRAVTL